MDAWKDRTAFVTGGGSGIGRALAKAMASRGAIVCVADNNGDAARHVATECGERATSLALDVRDAAAVRSAIEGFAARHGALAYLFNNAGIGHGGETHELALEEWHRVVDVNLFGVLHGVLAAYPLMRRQGGGHIVNTASMAGLVPSPLITSYAMTKHAVVGLSTSLRIEAAPFGVRVSALCPGVIDTPILETKPPPGAWAPDARRFLTQVAGPPHPVDDFAQQVLARVERNERIIVAPARARIGWLLSRWFPGLPEPLLAKAVAAERATRAPAAALPMASGDELPAQQAPR